MQSIKREFSLIIASIFMILLLGVLGYVYLEGFPVIDALYMTVITLTTVGFGEIQSLDHLGRLFTILLIFLGLGTIAYSTKVMVDFLSTGQLLLYIRRNRMEKKIDNLKNHFIVCGYGRMGQFISDLLSKRKLPFVVIENDAKLCEYLRATPIILVEGNAQHDDVLIFAGIARAKCLITTLGTDADNIFVVLTAKGLNPELKIATRLNEPLSEPKLYRAGANIVVSPHFVGGQRIVTSILKPTFVEFLDKVISVTGMEIDFDEIQISEKSPLNGKTISQSRIGQEFNVTILTIKKHDKQYIPKISGNTVLEQGDLLLALGNYEQLVKLREIAGHN
ncbi:MAG: hypothetical protein A2161_07350 [Candidatus Schekmanbacteria bacterium RBG_13_48_7]|uniref:Potassium transporter TrkA n=1 Tax=Candidatus Schekmanbacteria bacterium RBG_13_48_7 TaxID=1817878 RepID=A0A1F7S7S8_9BACT|nr:MAG: hypothetical protein A2161_07350 [Candidatus Schekmanbacteria bacterium RBG_13_48_7]